MHIQMPFNNFTIKLLSLTNQGFYISKHEGLNFMVSVISGSEDVRAQNAAWQLFWEATQ